MGLVVAAALALLFAYYAWTATSSGNPFTKVNGWGFNSGNADYYNLQADAFLHGHLWLDVPIDPKLLTAKDPYALARADFTGLPDGAFYDGKYYLSWGPAPALTTFLPPRLVGVRIQENLAVTLYCFFGVLFGAMVLTRLVRRLVPETSRTVVWAGNVAFALATAIPWILRRPTVYEVSISAAFCFMMAGLLLLVRELLRDDEEPQLRRSRLAWAGVLFGLAVLSRPTMVFVVVGVAVLGWAIRPEARRVLALFIVGIPAIAGVIFMVYNAARFSGPLDFGGKWQTSGRDVRNIPFNDITNLPPAMYGYLVAPLRFALEFPYVQLPPPPAAPFSGKAGFTAEPTAGVLWAVPFTLLALVLLARGRGREVRAPGVTRVVFALIVITVLAFFPGIFAVPGYTERYELDFLPWLVMAATLAWAELIRRSTSARRAKWWRRAGVALVAWSALIGVAVGFTGYYNSFKANDFGRFQALERVFSPLPTLATVVAGRPMIAGIDSEGNPAGNHVSYKTIDVDGASFIVAPQRDAIMTIVSPGARDARLTFTASTYVKALHTIGAGDGDDLTSINVEDGDAATLPMHLKRGVNYVHVWVGSAPGPVIVREAHLH